MNDKFLSFLGLARRAGKLMCGVRAVEEGIRSGHVRLIIMATDATSNTARGLFTIATRENIVVIKYGTMLTIGNAVGSGETAAVALTDKGFADAAIKKYREGITQSDFK